jgi:hypothetical protein
VPGWSLWRPVPARWPAGAPAGDVPVSSSLRRRGALVLSAAGCALAVVSGVHLADGGGARALPRAFTTRVAPTPAPVPTPSPPAAVAPTPVSAPPARLSIPALGVDAPVGPVADTRSEITVPDDVSTVGWWVAGAAPGDPVGTTVLVGHVDAWDQGAGALYHLDGARPGMPVAVTTTDGRTTSYAVTGLQVVRKAAGLPPSLFDQAGAPRLVLVTCGGPFDERTRSYADNIVVVAIPG